MSYCRLQLERLPERIAPYVLGKSAWPIGEDGHVSLTYSYRTEVPRGGRAAMEAAFDSWAHVAPLDFTEVAQDGNIRITFGEPPGPNPAVVGRAAYPGSNPDAGDIYFTTGAVRQLREVTTHEVGHSLGLAHSQEPAAIMWFAADGVFTGLHQDDIAGVRALYGPGVGGVTPLPFHGEPLDPLPPPAVPFAGFAGQTQRGIADLDGDRVEDAVFLAQGASGHLRAFSGATGEKLMDVLAFPGFTGTCVLAAEGGRVVVAAVLPEATHLKGYIGGQEVASILTPRIS